jgi:CubicO group peptidase (beta-lactamase class C family)
MNRCQLLVISAIVAASACAPAARPAASPAPAPSAVEARIDSIFRAFGPSTPGCAVGVYRAGETVFARGYGLANLEHDVPITPETVLDLGTVTRQFTAYAIHLLALQDRLSLDDDVRKHVPELPELGPVTLRHLLTHTSGLRDIIQLRLLSYPGGWNEEVPLTRAEAMDLLSRQRALNFAPGERRVTSNTDWMLLAMVVERASGRPFGAFLDDEVFAPLGMTSTRILDDPRRVVPGRATAYLPAPHGGYRAFVSWSLVQGLPGSSYLHSTISDLARWEANLSEVRTAEIMARMSEPVRLASGDTLPHGQGIALGYHRGLRMIHHGGQHDNSELVRLPDRGLSVAVLCNRHEAGLDRTALARAVADLYLGELSAASAPPPGPVLDPALLSRYAGSFKSENSLREFVVHEGSLAEREGERIWPMVARGDGRFEDEQIRLDFAPDGSAATLFVKHDGARMRLTRTPDRWRPWTPTPAEMAEYAGTFRSAELGVEWTIRMEDGALVLRPFGAPEQVLLPLAADRFRTRDGGLPLEFRRGADGEVASMLVSLSRTQALEFVRWPARRSEPPGRGSRPPRSPHSIVGSLDASPIDTVWTTFEVAAASPGFRRAFFSLFTIDRFQRLP